MDIHGAVILFLIMLPAAVRGYISWVRLYTGYPGREINSYMDKRAIAESVHAYGECCVDKAMPGYGFLFVWIDTKHRADEGQGGNGNPALKNV